jgi:hypothetical protein
VTANGAVEFKALGLDLELTPGEEYDLVQPLEILLVVKGLDSEDNVRYWAVKTPGLTKIEARGYADYALEVARR